MGDNCRTLILKAKSDKKRLLLPENMEKNTILFTYCPSVKMMFSNFR